MYIHTIVPMLHRPMYVGLGLRKGVSKFKSMIYEHHPPPPQQQQQLSETHYERTMKVFTMCNPEVSVCKPRSRRKGRTPSTLPPIGQDHWWRYFGPLARHSETLLRYEIILAHPRTMVLTGNLRKFRSPALQPWIATTWSCRLDWHILVVLPVT